MTNYDDEYKYPEEEYVAADTNDMESADEIARREMEGESTVDDAAEVAVAKEGFVAKLTNGFANLPTSGKRTITIVGVIIVLMVIAYGVLAFQAKQNAIKPVAQVQAAKPVAAVAPSQSQQNYSAMQQQSMQQAAALAQSKAKVSGLQQQVTAVQAAFSTAQQANSALQDKVAMLQQQVEQSNAVNSELTSQIAKLNTAIDQLQKQVGIAKARKASLAKDKIQFIAHYTLTGMVSGRAWVKDQRGRITSVKVGDELKDFGIVAKVNSDAGYIESRKGKLIEYGLNV